MIIVITKNSAFFFDKNKNVIGKMRDEAVGMVIKEFIGLRSKMHSYKISNKITKKKKNAREYLNTPQIKI